MLVQGSQRKLPICWSVSLPPIPDRFLPAASFASENEILDQPHQSCRITKSTRKIESQLLCKAEERRIEEKGLKICKFKF